MKSHSSFRILGSLALGLFLALGYIVKWHLPWLLGFDQPVTNIIRAPFPVWNSYQLLITKLGNPFMVILIFLGVLLLFWKQKKKPELIWFASNVIMIAGLANPLIKLFFMRERPTLQHLVVETSYSFPSGHAATSMILYGSLLFLMPTLIEQPTIRTLLQVFMAFIIVSVGISRIYLGVHFPSDIVGGYLLSFAYLCLTYPVYKQKKNNDFKINQKKEGF